MVPDMVTDIPSAGRAAAAKQSQDVEDAHLSTCSDNCKFKMANGCRLDLAGVGVRPSTCNGSRRGSFVSTTASSIDAVEVHDSLCQLQSDESETSDPLSPKTIQTCTTRSHLDLWHSWSETMIMFDWDDTLCPSTYIFDEAKLPWQEPAKPEVIETLQRHATIVEELLREATEVGRVFIVTLATKDWFTCSIRNFMPSLEGLLEELHIEVVYAREALPESVLCSRMSDGFEDLGQASKTAAMQKIASDFYRSRPRQVRGSPRRSRKRSNKPGRSWKNVISIGDSNSEYYGLQDVTFHRKQTDRHGEWKTCRCKAVKLLESPGLHTLTAELEVLMRWLPSFVAYDGDIDLDFGDLGEDATNLDLEDVDFETLSPKKDRDESLSPKKAESDERLALTGMQVPDRRSRQLVSL